METTFLEKPAKELTTEELTALLAQKEKEQSDERRKARAAYESLRDTAVSSMVKRALELNRMLAEFKEATYEEIATLYAMLQEHSGRHANGKGSVTLDSSSGNFRVSYKRHDATRFDERATQAEEHIRDFIAKRWGNRDDSDSKFIKGLLARKNGKLDKNKVLDMISMRDNYEDENWRKGIDLLQESIVPDYTKYYAQFFYRSDNDEWIPIVLDFAKLSA